MGSGCLSAIAEILLSLSPYMLLDLATVWQKKKKLYTGTTLDLPESCDLGCVEFAVKVCNVYVCGMQAFCIVCEKSKTIRDLFIVLTLKKMADFLKLT